MILRDNHLSILQIIWTMGFNIDFFRILLIMWCHFFVIFNVLLAIKN